MNYNNLYIFLLGKFHQKSHVSKSFELHLLGDILADHMSLTVKMVEGKESVWNEPQIWNSITHTTSHINLWIVYDMSVIEVQGAGWHSWSVGKTNK